MNNKCTVITFHSAKGGVGKSTLIRNLSVLLANKGKRVLVYECSMSGNMNKLMNVYSEYTTDNIHTKPSSEISIFLTPDKFGVNLISHGKQIVLEGQREITEKIIDSFSDQFDVLLIDTDHRLSVNSIISMLKSDFIYMLHDNNENAVHCFIDRLNLLIGEKSSGEGFSLDKDKIKVIINKYRDLDYRRFIKDLGYDVTTIPFNEEYEKISDSSNTPYVDKNKRDKFTSVLLDFLDNTLENKQKEKRFVGGFL